MAKKKKQQSSNLAGWVILGVIGFGIYQFGVVGQGDTIATATTRSPAARAVAPTPTPTPAASVPLNVPRFVNVASLNVRHAPSQSAPLVTALPRGTHLRVLGRTDGWLLVDLSPTLEGWVWEPLTTTEKAGSQLRPPEALAGRR